MSRFADLPNVLCPETAQSEADTATEEQAGKILSKELTGNLQRVLCRVYGRQPVPAIVDTSNTSVYPVKG